jgi:hypothetical protein
MFPGLQQVNRTWPVPRHEPPKVRWIFPESGRTEGADSEALNAERTLRILPLLPGPLLLLLEVEAQHRPPHHLLLQPEAQHRPPHRLRLQPEAQHRRPRLRKRLDAVPEVNVEAAASEAALHCRRTAFL